MRLPRGGAVLRRIRRFIANPDFFLKDVSGVVHVGASAGQERDLYEKHGLRVIWIEPIPEAFAALERNLRDFPRQRAIRCLVTDQDDVEYQFHIANNSVSSSILDIKHLKDIWPTVAYTSAIALRSTTLATLLAKQGIDPSQYQALIMDTQGSELLVLKGSVPLLGNFKYIKTEVADFEAYEGCCLLADIEAFMTGHGYAEFSRMEFANRPGGGGCYDIVYKRRGV